MARCVWVIGLAAAVLLASGCATEKATTFGAPQSASLTAPLTVKDVMANVPKYEGKTIRVKGTVTALCETSGCWIEIADGPRDEQKLFCWFTFDKAAGRVPPAANGHAAVVEGKLVSYEIPEVQRKHFAEEKGLPKAEIDKIKGPEKAVKLECSSAKIMGIEPAEPQACPHEPPAAEKQPDAKSAKPAAKDTKGQQPAKVENKK